MNSRLLLVFLLFASLACTSQSAPDRAEVTVEIDYGDSSRSEEMALVNGTAFDAFSKAADLSLSWHDMDGDGEREPLVTGVDGFNQTATRFWIFYVNGKMASAGIDSYRPFDGDVLSLKYERSPF